jgi:hypothetical protein
MQQSEILNSWKEVSNYIGRGVRTVQRWEKDFGLPVRRPCGHLRGSVFAVRTDIDQWLATRGSRVMKAEARASYQPGEATQTHEQYEWLHVKTHAHHERLHKNAKVLMERCTRLKAGSEELEANIRRIEALRARLRTRYASGAGQNAVA